MEKPQKIQSKVRRDPEGDGHGLFEDKPSGSGKRGGAQESFSQQVGIWK
jgi:hypothetical protein